MLVHSHPSRSALASLPKGQSRHFLTFLFESPPEITSDSERRERKRVAIERHRRSVKLKEEQEREEEERERKVEEEEEEEEEEESRFLCAGKQPSVLLWFQLLCPSVNRVISHGPRCTHDIRFSSTWGPVPLLPSLPLFPCIFLLSCFERERDAAHRAAPFARSSLFHLHGSLLPTRARGMSLEIRVLAILRQRLNALRKY